MNRTKLSSKTDTPKRESRSDKGKKEAKADKVSSKIKNSSSTRFEEDRFNRKHRSDSLQRQTSIKHQESPRKAQSIDRNLSYRPNMTNASDSKDIQKNSFKIKNDFSKKTETSISTPSRHQSNASKMTQNPNSDTKNQAKKSMKNVERKNSKKVAKSFVKSSEAKTKVSKTSDKYSSKKVEGSNHENGLEQDSLQERPRTSTIRKGISKSIISSSNTNKTEESKTLNSGTSRNQINLNGESDNDKSSYEEDFEEYDSDFEESEVDSESKSDSDSSSTEDQEIDRNIRDNITNLSQTSQALEMQPPINLPKKNVEKAFLNLSDRSSLFHRKANAQPADSKPIKLSRSIINFASAVDKEVLETEDIQYTLQDSVDKHNDNHPEFQEVIESNYNLISKSNSKQVFVQTQNAEEDEIQTDEIELCNKWTQNPSNGTLGCGGDKDKLTKDKASSWKSLFNVNSTKLSAFIKKSSDIIITLLDEEFTDFITDYKTKKRDNLFYSDAYFVLSPLNFLSSIPIVNMYSSDCSPYIITIHGAMVQVPIDNGFSNEKGIICVWNTMESKQPKYILTGNSQPTCGTFGPGGYDIVIAGMTDGAIMLWDLTVLSYSQLRVELDGPLTLLSPTYNTALIFEGESPRSSVVQVQTVHSQSKEDWRSFGSERRVGTKNFHVLALEDMGVMKIWVVVEVLKPDISGLESDLGLAPGGKYRLVQSSCLLLYNLPTLQMEQKISIRTFDFRVVPFDTSRILVTTDVGIVLQITRHSGGVEPRFYSNDRAVSSEIRCIDYSPHNEDLFLIGCSDGSITLFNIKLVHPIREFLQGGKGESVNLLRWSIEHPTIFCVLSSTSHIHLWNIMEDSTHPLHSYNFDDCKITWFVFKNVLQTSNHLVKRKSSNFIIAKENGEVEVHTFQLENLKSEFQTQLEYLQNF